MVIDKEHPALQGSSSDFIKDEIDNSKILLYEIDKAIAFLSKNKYSKYSIDTGQDQMAVTFPDLPSLYDRRAALIDLIAELENRRANRPSYFIARPV